MLILMTGRLYQSVPIYMVRVALHMLEMLMLITGRLYESVPIYMVRVAQQLALHMLEIPV